jgi:MEMO1 family protein
MMREKPSCTVIPIMSGLFVLSLPFLTIQKGKLNSQTVSQYAEVLLPYFLDPENLFIISRFLPVFILINHSSFRLPHSDFCHWGQRFRYTPYDESKVLCYKCRPIYISFSLLSREVSIATSTGWIMKLSNLSNHWFFIISSEIRILSTLFLQDHRGFAKYIKETKNTICGQDPIKVLLELIQLSEKSYHSRFVSEMC